jgi:AbrB family looped-hinge helix DNA binding protein
VGAEEAGEGAGSGRQIDKMTSHGYDKGKYDARRFSMIIAIDKRGSINLPASVRKELGLKNGDHMDLSVQEGGVIVLQPVVIYPTVQLSEEGLGKLNEARESGVREMPSWFDKEIENAKADSKWKVSGGH